MTFIIEKDESKKQIKVCCYHYGLTEKGKQEYRLNRKGYEKLGYSISDGMCSECSEKY